MLWHIYDQAILVETCTLVMHVCACHTVISTFSVLGSSIVKVGDVKINAICLQKMLCMHYIYTLYSDVYTMVSCYHNGISYI